LDVLEAVKNTTNLKAVLRIKNPEEARSLPTWFLALRPRNAGASLIRPTVVGHRLAKLKGEKRFSDQVATTEMRTDTE